MTGQIDAFHICSGDSSRSVMEIKTLLFGNYLQHCVVWSEISMSLISFRFKEETSLQVPARFDLDDPFIWTANLSFSDTDFHSDFKSFVGASFI
jgi:hypothetical protein